MIEPDERELAGSHLEPRFLTAMSNSQISRDSDRSQDRLPVFHLPEAGWGDRQPVHDPAGETRGGRRIPNGDPERSGLSPDVCFRVACFHERRSNTVLGSRLRPRAMVVEIITVRPVDDAGELVASDDVLELFPQLVFAEVASTGGVCRVTGVADFAGGDFDHPNVEHAGDAKRLPILRLGQGGTHADRSRRPLAPEDPTRDHCKERRVYPAGITDQERGECSQEIGERRRAAHAAIDNRGRFAKEAAEPWPGTHPTRTIVPLDCVWDSCAGATPLGPGEPMMRTLWVAVLAAGALWAAGALAVEHRQRPTVMALRFMAGCWRGQFARGAETGIIEEHYTEPSDNTLLGTTRYLLEQRTIQYELTVITQDSAGVWMIPYPGGRRSEHAFLLTGVTENRAIFEAPEHDYPKRIIYRADGDSVLRASIDAGPRDERPRTWTMTRSKCP